MKATSFTIEIKPGLDGKPRAHFPGRIIDMEDVELLISALGRFRKLAPDSSDLPQELELQTDAPFEVSNSVQGMVLAIRDSRYGWLGYVIDQAKRVKLIDDLLEEEDAERVDKDAAH